MEKNNLINKIFIVGMLLLLTVLSFIIVQGFILSIFLGAVIAYAIYPVYTWLLKKTKSERNTAVILSLSAMFILVILGLILIPEAVNELGKILVFYQVGLPEKLSEISNCSADSNDLLCQVSSFALRNFDKSVINALVDTLAKPTSDFILTLLVDFFKNLPSLFLSFTIVVFSIAYFLHNGKRIVLRAVDLMPLKQENKEKVVARVDEVMKAVIFGNLIVAFLEGGAVTIFFLVLGIKPAFIAGILVMFFALIPPLGAAIVWAPAVVVLLILGEYLKGILLLVLCIVFLGYMDNIARPMFIGRLCKLSPFWVLLGVLGGLATYGFAGIIIGPLVLSLFVTSLKILEDEMKDEHKEVNV
jgi:predicted PurR-regulated permease PerM